MIGELRRQRLMRAIILGDHQEAARVLVEPVHDARPPHAADARQAVAAMGDERVDERAARMPRRRMHDEPGRLVDHDEVVVLVDDRERNRLRLRLGRHDRRHDERDARARARLERRIAHNGIVDGDAPVADQRLQAAARQVGEGARQDAVEPLRRAILRHDEFAPVASGRRNGGLRCRSGSWCRRSFRRQAGFWRGALRRAHLLRWEVMVRAGLEAAMRLVYERALRSLRLAV